MVEIEVIVSAIVIGLAVSVIRIIIVDTEGPFGLLLKLNNWANEFYYTIDVNDGHKIVNYVRPLFQGLYACDWCMCFWLALAASVVHALLFGRSVGSFLFAWIISIWFAVLFKNIIVWFQGIDL